ncbi:hypothetical protein DL89DRAFT_262428 [Linderina pennispora]|uniref:Uncharacterized protein n=1 Tax=Linderina pennispora TaxID=61395 RepID=A0A1Y1VSX1_9FUNG|nr:uncharacterized protein DL89DRAFT_262428 [Linderina pennispora]ORX64391.1 hypothetical protein DL89DRAFT_262428 [Linderina pennispora]
MTTTKSRSFPVDVNVTAALIDDVHTDVAVLGFANCVVVLITQLASVGSIIQAVTSRVSYNDGEFGDLVEVDDVPVDIKFVLGNAKCVQGSVAVPDLRHARCPEQTQAEPARHPAAGAGHRAQGAGWVQPAATRGWRRRISSGQPHLCNCAGVAVAG